METQPNYKEVNVWILVYCLDMPFYLQAFVRNYLVKEMSSFPIHDAAGNYHWYRDAKYYVQHCIECDHDDDVVYERCEYSERNQILFGLFPWRIVTVQKAEGSVYCLFRKQGDYIGFGFSFSDPEVSDLRRYWQSRIFLEKVKEDQIHKKCIYFLLEIGKNTRLRVFHE